MINSKDSIVDFNCWKSRNRLKINTSLIIYTLAAFDLVDQLRFVHVLMFFNLFFGDVDSAERTFKLVSKPIFDSLWVESMISWR